MARPDESRNKMNYASIKRMDVANGPGVRMSLFVSGCTHYCKNCFNQEAWDFGYGKPFTDKEIEMIVNYVSGEYIAGLSLLGGEPLEPENQKGILPLLRRMKEVCPEKSIWCYPDMILKKMCWEECWKKFRRQRKSFLTLMYWWTGNIRKKTIIFR